jgi:hypothetical protein
MGIIKSRIERWLRNKQQKPQTEYRDAKKNKIKKCIRESGRKASNVSPTHSRIISSGGCNRGFCSWRSYGKSLSEDN